MVSQVGALRVTVGANINPLQADMRRAERVVSKSAGSMSRAVQGINKSLTGLGSIAGVALGGAGLLAGASAFIRVADAAKSLSAQLKLATAEYGSFERANKDVRAIAEQTRSGLLETADLYATLQRNSGQLGATQEQVARATETVTKSFKISGAATAQQEQATRQLIQAFQSGVLRGDEFNSMAENAPRLQKLLADSIIGPNGSMGALRKMAEEGELTSDKLLHAFTDKKFTESIDAEFKQMPVTFDQAMTQVYNSAIIVFSEFDRGGQFSTSLANFVTDGAEGFKTLGDSAFQFGRDVADTFAAVDQIRQALASLQSEGISGFLGLQNATYGWRDALADTLGVLDSIINTWGNAAMAPGNLVKMALGWDPLIVNSDMRGGFLRETNERNVAATRQQIMGRSARDVLSEFGMERRPPAFRPPAAKPKKGAGAKKAPRDRSDDVEFQFAQELRQAQMDVLRAQQSMAVTHDERARIAIQLLDAERQMKEAELNDRVRRAERDFAEKKITAGALEQVKAQADKLKAEYDNADALERQAVANDLAAQKAQDAAALVDSNYDIQLEKLQLESSLADTAAERRDAELRILALAKEQEKARLEAVKADKDSSELAKAQAQQRLDELDSIYSKKADVTRAGTRGPLEQAQVDFSDLSEEMENLKVNGIMGVADAFTTLLTDTENWKETTISMVQQVIAEFIRLQTLKFLFSMIGSAAGAGAGAGSVSAGSSGLYAGIDPMFLGGFASGGNTLGVPRNKIAGVVHGMEGILNPRGLSNLGVPNLDLLNRGAPLSALVGNDNMRGANGGDMNVSVTLPRGMAPREGRATGLAIGRGIIERQRFAVRGRK